MRQKWDRNGTKMGQEQEQKWGQNGTEMGQKWGQKMGQKWDKNRDKNADKQGTEKNLADLFTKTLTVARCNLRLDRFTH